MNTDVSIVIVNYNTRDITLACLKSVYEQTREVSFEVILVDNGSEDGSIAAIREQFPQVRLIEAGRNLGFARANNLASQHAAGRYICLLNSDTVVLDDAISELVQFADRHPDAAACGGRTFFRDLSLNPNSCWAAPTLWSTFCQAVGLATLFPNSRLFNSEAIGGWDRSTSRKVEIVSGCFMLMALGLWSQVGGFDTSFFMYGEDAELCIRLRQMGYTCFICPTARIIHYGGGSERVRADSVTRLFRAKSELFVRFWKNSLAKRLGIRLFDLWAIIRCVTYTLLGFASRQHAERARIWHTIWRRRAEWHVLSHSAQPAPSTTTDAITPGHA